ncbi:MTFP1 [Acanthosepion pharaonis]|uniref:Mitochondrial fission process protein 1 n=1 Tax=Acanthosepion pharaonis TaxID=158019 RepID=A0A812C6Z6_ACAPH|nr:MTFP1 [Sepia pharaonis]
MDSKKTDQSPVPPEKPAEVDIYRDTFVRYLGYANEVGEAFRALVHVNVVRFSYVVACSYVAADANHKGSLAAEKTEVASEVTKERAIAMADTLVWQGLASVAVPGFTINRVCALSNNLLQRTSTLPSNIRKWTTTFIGLGCIPFIVKPIDHSVDYMMNNTLRKFYVSKPEPPGIFHHERDD